MLDSLRSGAWLTPARLHAYPLLLIAITLAAIAGAVATAHGDIDITGRPLGADFSQVWAAGVSVLDGNPALPFDPPQHYALLRRLFGPATPFYGWHYPPYFLALATVLAVLPYLWALLVWQASTLALYGAMIWRIAPSRWLLLGALGFPAVFVNLGHGHNGFLTAALLGFGVLALPKRPWLAGLCFALLAYKPQFGLVLPVALLADRRFAATAAAALGVAAMTVASLAAFGLPSWLAFRASLAFTREVVLEQGNTGWEKIQSSFAAVRALGAGAPAAYAVQGAVTLAVVLAVAWLWHGRADRRLKYAGLIIGSLLSSPYVLVYDLVALAQALAFLLVHGQQHGFRPWQKTGMAVVYIAPFLTRIIAGATLIPFGLLAMLWLFGMVLVRAKQEWTDVEDSRPGELQQRAEGAVGRG